ncbi:class I SAM-dependent methyltransferase [Trichloromonas sp.]|uniref:class I SAM-dependent methyltransferase n=1 Tax=Trichloromonas sp. TaxID=3069249 RepID=UPI001D5B24C4|nr:class I SAM-dependent methyltransferase [Syntrophaceae bacterium]MDY0268626.1 class I SAM-dependent methyltransferase [Trichloromonas sp.]
MKYAFQGYKKAFLDGLGRFGLENATLLDVGCGRGECVTYLTETTKAAKVFGVDPGLNDNPMYAGASLQGESYQLFPASAENTGFPDQSIDVIFSLVVFEHLPFLKETLEEFYRILKPGGIFVSFWSPLWSSRHGHHFMFWIPELAPLLEPWSHLLLTQENLRAQLNDYLHPSAVDYVIRSIYESSALNRRPYRDYIDAFAEMSLERVYLKELMTQAPPPEVFDNLPIKFRDGCRVGGFDVVFQRPGGSRQVSIDEVEAFFAEVHKPVPKPDVIFIDNEKILGAIGKTKGGTLVFTRQEAQVADAEALRSQLSNFTLVEHELKPGQLIPKYDLAIILQSTESNFSFTQAISHVIRAKRIIAVDETGVVMELSSS